MKLILHLCEIRTKEIKTKTKTFKVPIADVFLSSPEIPVTYLDEEDVKALDDFFLTLNFLIRPTNIQISFEIEKEVSE